MKIKIDKKDLPKLRIPIPPPGSVHPDKKKYRRKKKHRDKDEQDARNVPPVEP